MQLIQHLDWKFWMGKIQMWIDIVCFPSTAQIKEHIAFNTNIEPICISYWSLHPFFISPDTLFTSLVYGFCFRFFYEHEKWYQLFHLCICMYTLYTDTQANIILFQAKCLVDPRLKCLWPCMCFNSEHVHQHSSFHSHVDSIF